MAGRLAGAASSHAMLWLTRDGARRLWFGRPVPFAAACGLLVAMIGVAGGDTWSTGYAAARVTVAGVRSPLWFSPATFAAGDRGGGTAGRHLRADAGDRRGP